MLDHDYYLFSCVLLLTILKGLRSFFLLWLRFDHNLNLNHPEVGRWSIRLDDSKKLASPADFCLYYSLKSIYQNTWACGHLLLFLVCAFCLDMRWIPAWCLSALSLHVLTWLLGQYIGPNNISGRYWIFFICRHQPIHILSSANLESGTSAGSATLLLNVKAPEPNLWEDSPKL